MKLLGYNEPDDGSIRNLSPHVSPCFEMSDCVGKSKLSVFYWDILYNKISLYRVWFFYNLLKSISSIEKKTFDPISLTILLWKGITFYYFLKLFLNIFPVKFNSISWIYLLKSKTCIKSLNLYNFFSNGRYKQYR